MLKQGRRKATEKLKKFRNRILGYDQKIHIFIPCFPKSGSTYLTSILREITGFSKGGLAERLSISRGQDIRREKIEKYLSRNSVAKQHVLATKNNVALLKEYQYKAVPLTRNIYDTVLSLHDYIEQQIYRTTGYIHQEYRKMHTDDKILHIIRIHLPWYFMFLISWEEASKEIPLCWVSYKDVFNDQVGTISKILKFYSITVDSKQIENAIEVMKYRNTRFNVGKSGRGESISDIHKAAIHDLADCWKVDPEIMKRIGIEVK